MGACALTPYNLGLPRRTCEWDIFMCTCGLSWEDRPSWWSTSAKEPAMVLPPLHSAYNYNTSTLTWLQLYRSSCSTTTSTKPMSTLGVARHVRSSTLGAWPNQCLTLGLIMTWESISSLPRQSDRQRLVYSYWQSKTCLGTKLTRNILLCCKCWSYSNGDLY